MKNLLYSTILVLIGSFIQPEDRILGDYWTPDKTGKIRIFRCQDHYCGKILWRQDARKDQENPNPNLRERSVVGIVFLKGFEYKPKKQDWQGGTVYSIENGGTYRGRLWLEDEGKTLKMRGYMGISLLGKTLTLTRVE